MRELNHGAMLHNPMLKLDYYKVGHINQYPVGTEKVYSTFIPRSNKWMPFADKAVFFGLQGFIKKYLIEDMNTYFFNRPKEEVVEEYTSFMNMTLGLKDFDASHIAALHDLGYMPIEIKALEEGTLVPMRVTMFTLENTLPEFYWVTNYIESLMSAIIWKSVVSATISHKYRKEFDRYADLTGYDKFSVNFQGHDFSYRGMAGDEAAQLSGAGHLVNFLGTDTIPAILYLNQYYGGDIANELVGTSIPATEHSVMCAGGADHEFETIERLFTETYPSGLVSIVSDTWDFFGALENIYKPLKDKIMARDGKVVIRPDSGDPVKIVCGYEIIDVNRYKWIDTIDEVFSEIEYVGREEVLDNVVYKFKGKYYLTTVTEDMIDWKEISKAEAIGAWETLWDIFGGTVNDKGYKVLDDHIGLIYGDAITVERQAAMLAGLEAKGFAPTLVLGIGSYTYNANTRDSLGMAIKATSVTINGVDQAIFKDPKTDDGVKKSPYGKVQVLKDYRGNLVQLDESDAEYGVIANDLLETVFKDGKLVKETTIAEIRNRLR